MDTTQQSHYATINGLNLYYEIHGSGQPLVLLPGGYMTIQAMGAIVPELATTRRVVAIELQGHGHTADIERPFRFELMVDDVAALITQSRTVGRRRRTLSASEANPRSRWGVIAG